MIILEGPDGSGKTTLSNLIKAAFPEFKSLHSPGPLTQEVLKERMFWNEEMTKIDFLIADRVSIFSEYVYGNIIRDGALVDIADVHKFMMNFEKRSKNILVLCARSFKPTTESDSQMSSEEQKELDVNVGRNIDRIRDLYRKLTSSLHQSFNHNNIFVVECQEDVVGLVREIQTRYIGVNK